MGRVTPEEVADIIKVNANINVQPFIDVADSLVDDVCLDSDYSDSKLKIIEQWLAAHFYAVRDPRVDTQKAGPVSQKLQYKVDLGFHVTVYGQQALLLDTAGNLALLNKQAKEGKSVASAGLVWAGTEVV